MHTVVKRTHVYLTEEQDRRLTARARREGVSKSDLIRRALDAYLGDDRSEEEALARLRATVRWYRENPVEGDWDLEAWRAADVVRQKELDRRWRS